MIFKAFSRAKTANKIRRVLNWYGPYLGAGVKIEYIADDWHEIRVAMHMKWYNRNAVGTHFGGSLYAMIDPHFMLMLMKLLGKDYIVWDKSAQIDFIKPGTGTVRAVMKISADDLAEITNMTQSGDKYLPKYEVEIIDQQGELVARAIKTLYIKKKANTASHE
jgi:acyl-coenzyme A thioesterase PaaI-like protein